MGLDDTGTFFLPCLNSEACDEAGSCASGYTGPGCAECESDLVLSDGYKCKACPSELTTVFAILIGGIMFLAYIVYKLMKKRKGEAPSQSQVFYKIALSTCQVNAVALSFAFDWRAFMVTYLEVQDTITSFGVSYIELSCLGDTDPSQNNTFVLESVIYILLPLVLIVVSLLMATTQYYFQSKALLPSEVAKASLEHTTHHRKNVSTLGSLEMYLETESALIQYYKVAKTSSIGMAIITLYLLQPNLVKQFALLFSCIRMGKDSTEHLLFMENLAVTCYSPAHWLMIWTLGLPLLLM